MKRNKILTITVGLLLIIGLLSSASTPAHADTIIKLVDIADATPPVAEEHANIAGMEKTTIGGNVGTLKGYSFGGAGGGPFVTVTFDTDGGSPHPQKQVINKGDQATEPAPPSKSGYTFNGWMDTSVNQKWDFNDSVTKNLQLKASYSAKNNFVAVSVVRKASGERLGDAKLKVLNQTTGENWILNSSDFTPLLVYINYGETFEISQTKPPEGYRLFGHGSFELRVNENIDIEFRPTGQSGSEWKALSSNEELNFENCKEWPLTLSKVAEGSPDIELSGAKLQFGRTGYPAEHIFDSGVPECPKTILIPELIPHTFSETKVPPGYQKAQDIVFYLNASGMIVLESGEGIAKNPVPPEVLPPVLRMVNRKETPETSKTSEASKTSETSTTSDTSKTPDTSKISETSETPETTPTSGATTAPEKATPPKTQKPSDGAPETEGAVPLLLYVLVFVLALALLTLVIVLLVKRNRKPRHHRK
jgi:uncharacterized repeat protein (TIGR02543 family)